MKFKKALAAAGVVTIAAPAALAASLLLNKETGRSHVDPFRQATGTALAIAGLERMLGGEEDAEAGAASPETPDEAGSRGGAAPKSFDAQVGMNLAGFDRLAGDGSGVLQADRGPRRRDASDGDSAEDATTEGSQGAGGGVIGGGARNGSVATGYGRANGTSGGGGGFGSSPRGGGAGGLSSGSGGGGSRSAGDEGLSLVTDPPPATRRGEEGETESTILATPLPASIWTLAGAILGIGVLSRLGRRRVPETAT